MDSDLIKAQDSFLNKINQICGRFGLNNIMAQLYALLYLNNKALSLDDMVEQLRISKGSASTNIRALERYGAVRKVWIKGSRKDYYEAEMDIAKVILERVKSMAQNRLAEVDYTVNASYQMLDSISASDKSESERIEVFRDRLDKIKILHDNAASLLNLAGSGLLSNLLSKNSKKNNKDNSGFRLTAVKK